MLTELRDLNISSPYLSLPLKGLLLLTVILFVSGCQYGDSLDNILEASEIRVISRNGPTTYYKDKAGPTGFEYALAKLFAKELGVDLKMRTAHNLEDILLSLQRNNFAIAAAGLTATESRKNDFIFSRPYFDINAQVIYRAGTKRPYAVTDLQNKRIMVLANSNHIETLQKLKTEHPDIYWTSEPGKEVFDLMEMVATEAIDYTIVDSNEFVAQRSFFPKLRVGFSLQDDQHLVWVLKKSADNSRLQQRINIFFENIEADGTLDRLKEQHFGHAGNVNQVGSHTFTRNMERKLPRYKALIQRVATEYQLDWELLAAISYQESHWNPRATSPTGVRGMMMLTQATAGELNIENRLDVTESLRGGARYFKNLRRRLPEDIEEPDRTWLALASYNIGLGHLEDARVITERRGGDPDLWLDVKENLPLLRRSKWYKTVKYGYARGNEAVTYVQNIRHYYNILKWQDIAKNRPLPPITVDEFVPTTLQNTLSVM